MPCLQEVISIVMHQEPTELLKLLPNSNTAVQRSIDEMGNDIENNKILPMVG